MCSPPDFRLTILYRADFDFVPAVFFRSSQTIMMPLEF